MDFDIISCMKLGYFDVPQELCNKYGFTYRNFGEHAIVYTTTDGIELGNERFYGQFFYGNDVFHYCILTPITDIDSQQNKLKPLIEFGICDKTRNSIGNQIGQFQINIVKIASKNSIPDKYVLFIR